MDRTDTAQAQHALEVAQNPDTPPSAFMQAMQVLGAASAADVLPSLGRGRTGSAHVLTRVQDAEGFALGFVQGLRGAGFRVTVATYWLSTRVLCTNPWLDDATVVMSHCEGEVDPSAMLVALESVLGAVAGVSTMVLDALETSKFTGIRVASAIAHHQSEKLLRRELASEDARRMEVFAGKRIRRLRPDGVPEFGMHGSVAERSGLGDDVAALAYFPGTIERRTWERKIEPDAENDNGMNGP